MQEEESRVFRLSWTEVNVTLNQYLLNQMGHYTPCKARMVKRDYWAVDLYPYEISVKKLEHFLSREIAGGIAPKKPQAYNKSDGVLALDMAQSERLLSAALGYEWWSCSRMDRDFLWLIQIPGGEKKKPVQSLWIEGREIIFKDLAGRDELFAHLREYGANESELADFYDGCRTSYDEPLYCDYPLCDERNKRFFLALVREGIVKLPYDSHGFHEGAVFSLDDASLVSAEEMELFHRAWNCHATELCRVTRAMAVFLRRREEWEEEKD